MLKILLIFLIIVVLPTIVVSLFFRSYAKYPYYTKGSVSGENAYDDACGSNRC